MIFSSPVFICLFLPAVLVLYFIVVRRGARNQLLLVASLFFYAWGEPRFVFVMLASILANFLFGLWIDRAREGAAAKWAMACAVVVNLGLLCTFKYANFFVDNLNPLLSVFHIRPIVLVPIHLPIGISFFTFQAMSYVIDVYRKEAEVQRNPVNVALYISLFPQLLAGPIVRYRDIAEQLLKRTISREGFASGVKRFITGLGKKVLIADVIGKVVDEIFLIHGGELTPGLAWLGIICFTLQLYYDFSGYSDMAIGLGRMFGFRFLENFNYPYIARSMREFWRRWHISLSTWFRDYLYFPMGGNRVSPPRVYFNLVIVFLLCGLWHGAKWNYVIWGLSHGVFLVLERGRFGKWMESVWAPVGHFYMLFVFMVTLCFFRTVSLSHAVDYMTAMFGLCSATGQEHDIMKFVNTEFVLAMVAGVLFSTPLVPHFGRQSGKYIVALAGKTQATVEAVFLFGEVTAYIFVLLVSSAWLAGSTYQPFIYFRF